jgi:SAM-dependent methyltransferase
MTTIAHNFPPAAVESNWLKEDFDRFAAMCNRRERGFSLRWDERKPCLDDRTLACGFDRHYIYHTAWAARILAHSRPESHVDISSTLYFSAILSAFMPVEYYEYRPVNVELGNLKTGTADLQRLPFSDASITSLSCMHVIEHVGLGRYGDPIDPDADLKAMAELRRVLSPRGSLLFVVPVGQPRIVFNAHRIYSVPQVCEAMCGLHLQEFALIPDGRFNKGLMIDPPPQFVAEQNYGCGCFWFRK